MMKMRMTMIMDTTVGTIKTFWATRDDGPSGLIDYIKIWDKEPKFIEPNGCYAGKIFMGMFDALEWDGPALSQGECIEININFTTRKSGE